MKERSPDRPLIAMALVALVGPCNAQTAPIGWLGRQDVDLSAIEVMLMPVTAHFAPSEEHRDAYALSLNAVRADGALVGVSYFRNSFGQPCGYAYVGRRYVEPFGWENISWRWTAGIIYGYKEPYENKIPANIGGFAPVVVPSVAYQFNRHVSAELVLLGANAVMFGVAFQFDR